MLALLGDNLIGIDSLVEFLNKIVIGGQQVFDFVKKDAGELLDVHLLIQLNHGLVIRSPHRFRELNGTQELLIRKLQVEEKLSQRSKNVRISVNFFGLFLCLVVDNILSKGLVHEQSLDKAVEVADATRIVQPNVASLTLQFQFQADVPLLSVSPILGLLECPQLGYYIVQMLLTVSAQNLDYLQS